MADSNPMKGGPCVIYLHGNASAQLEGQFLVPNFCPHDIYVFVYDAIGCGCSDGDYISLGYFEKQDIEEIMQFLNQAFGLGPFALWGRSMGAATAALAKSPLLQSIVCDSAYTSIPDIVSAIAKSIGVPGFVVPLALSYLRSKIEKIAKFDLNTVEPIVAVKTARVPAVFGHAVKDQFVPYEMGKKLFDAYACGDKMFYTFERGGHNSRRNAEWIRTSVEFIMSRFGMDTFGIEISECRYLQSSKYHFTSFDSLLENKESNGSAPRNQGDTSTDTSTEDLLDGIQKSNSSVPDSKLIAGYDDEEATEGSDAEMISSSKEEAYMSDSDDHKNDETKNKENQTETINQNKQTENENSLPVSQEEQNTDQLIESISPQNDNAETTTEQITSPQTENTEPTTIETAPSNEVAPSQITETENHSETQNTELTTENKITEETPINEAVPTPIPETETPTEPQNSEPTPENQSTTAENKNTEIEHAPEPQ